MLEIDGELFDDPFETFRNEKTEAITEAVVSTVILCLKHKDNLTLIRTITEMSKVHIHMIQAQRLFPPKFAEGGIVCQLPDTAGDILTKAIEGEIMAYRKVGIVLRGDEQ